MCSVIHILRLIMLIKQNDRITQALEYGQIFVFFIGNLPIMALYFSQFVLIGCHGPFRAKAKFDQIKKPLDK